MRFTKHFQERMSWVKQKIIQADQYPKTVKLFYKGNTEFKTSFGGIISLIIKILVIGYGMQLLVAVFQRSHSTKSVTKIVKDLSQDTTKHYVGKGTFAFALKMLGSNPERLLDSTYFSLSMSMSTILRPSNGSESFTYYKVPIEFDYCADSFPYVEKLLYDKLGLQTYICPKDNDYFLSSTLISDEFTSLEIMIQRCLGKIERGCPYYISFSIDNV